MAGKPVNLQLDRSHALTLFEFLSRETERSSIKFDHPAEERVLWELCAMLESLLDEPLAPNYRELLRRARQEVLKGSG